MKLIKQHLMLLSLGVHYKWTRMCSHKIFILYIYCHLPREDQARHLNLLLYSLNWSAGFYSIFEFVVIYGGTRMFTEVGPVMTHYRKTHRYTFKMAAQNWNKPRVYILTYLLERFHLRVESGFALLPYTISLKMSCHSFIQSEVRPKSNVTRSHMFHCASRGLHVITSSFYLGHWITCVFCDWLN